MFLKVMSGKEFNNCLFRHFLWALYISISKILKFIHIEAVEILHIFVDYFYKIINSYNSN